MLLRHVARKYVLIQLSNKRHAHSFADRFDKYVPERLKPIWQHETGPKTIFFWAPFFKNVVVITALEDLHRDPSKISLFQTLSLLTNGVLASRYALVMEPKNFLYFFANFLLTVSQLTQIYRMYTYKPGDEH